MVERVARGRIMVPAVAALGALSAGLLAAGPAQAAGQNTTLQMRVQVVDTCQIRLAPGGFLDQTCGSGWQTLPRPSVSELVDDFAARAAQRFDAIAARAAQRFDAIAAPAWPARSTPPAMSGAIDAARAASANQRAWGVAAQIAERVRFITVTY